MAGAYGGQTAVYGVNVRTRVAAIAASRLERPLSAPYTLLSNLTRRAAEGELAEGWDRDAERAAAAIADTVAPHFPVLVSAQEVDAHQKALIESFEKDDPAMRESYAHSQKRVAALFDAWFE